MKSALLAICLLASSLVAHSETTIDPIYLESAARHVKEALSQGKPLPWRKDALVVPSESVAEAIHSAVAGAIYGEEEIKKQKPFLTVRSGEFWVVYGSLPKNFLGGTAVSVIRASNGEVLRVIHEQ